MQNDLESGWKPHREWKMVCSKFREVAAEFMVRCISFCFVMDGLEGAYKPTLVIRSADEGKYGGVTDTSEEET